MANVTTKIFMTLAFTGALSFSSASLAQGADAQAADAATPQTDTATEQPASTAPAKLGQGTKAEAEHSAEATAHKSLNDPNNQLGTSLQGRTRPVAGADNGPPYDTAVAGDTTTPGNAPEKIDQ